MPDAELKMLAAAFLAGRGHAQKEIAEILDLSQATVSRMLEQARREEFLRSEIRFAEEKLDLSTLQRVRQVTQRRELDEQLTRLATRLALPGKPELLVFSSGDQTQENIDKRLLTFSRHAAPYIKELIACSHFCGVTWGSTVWNLVGGLRNLYARPPWANREITFVPLSGEPLGSLPTSHSSSSLANELAKCVNGEAHTALSISMVPAFIPQGFTKAQLEGVWKLIRLVDAYDQIFAAARKETKPLVQRCDMILTSIGPAAKPLGYGGGGKLFETGNLKIEVLRKIVLGDMGGVCFPRPDLTKPEREIVRNINERWTGVKQEHLMSCAQRAFASKLESPIPGIVVAAIGAEKADFIFEAIMMGVINHLIIDETLEKRLIQLVSKALTAVLETTIPST